MRPCLRTDPWISRPLDLGNLCKKPSKIQLGGAGGNLMLSFPLRCRAVKVNSSKEEDRERKFHGQKFFSLKFFLSV